MAKHRVPVYIPRDDQHGRFQTSDGTIYERDRSGVIKRIGKGDPNPLPFVNAKPVEAAMGDKE